LPESKPTSCIHARGTNRSGHKMHPRKEVNEQIARDAGTVVAIISPAEQSGGFERNFRRASQEAVPIDVLARRIRMNRILPGPDRGVAILPGLHHVELSDRTGLH